MKPTSSSPIAAWRADIRCGLYGKGGVTPAVAKAFLPVPAVGVGVTLVAHLSTPQQVEARARISFHRARQKRGPPALLS